MLKKESSTQTPQASLPEWSTLTIRKGITEGRNRVQQVLMGDYLIFHVHEAPDSFGYKGGSTLIAFDLRDNSTQEIIYSRDIFPKNQYFTLSKYKDNQIITLGGYLEEEEDEDDDEEEGEEEDDQEKIPFGGMSRMTVKSFKRILHLLLLISPF